MALRRAFSSVASTAAAPLKHRPVMPLEGTFPLTANNAFIAPNATVIGYVQQRLPGEDVATVARCILSCELTARQHV